MNPLLLLWTLLVSMLTTTAVKSPSAVIGCLLDVSGSMRTALETGSGDGRAVERLRAVLSGVLKLVRTEQQQDPDALVFVGVFGLNTWIDCPPAVDLGSAIDALVQGRKEKRSGFELLIELANQNHLAHINKYIRDKLTDDESRIVYAYLRKHPEQVEEFVNAIPSEESIKTFKAGTTLAGVGSFAMAGAMVGTGPVGWIAGGLAGAYYGWKGANKMENDAVDNSEGMKLARRICADWLKNFVEFVPRPIGDVIRLLKELEIHSGSSDGKKDDGNILDTLRQYMYGLTPMRSTMTKSLSVFQQYPKTERRVLVLVSDGESTDGDPLPTALQFKKEKISIASIFLTSDITTPLRRLYDQEQQGWYGGQRALFSMAEKIPSTSHPIPVLASIGWEMPSSGEVALYTAVRSATALDEFCSLLLSARFGSSDALLDIMGRVGLDTYINNEHVRTRQNSSNQGDSGTCYAHATATVIHMALLRIDGRVGGCPSIDQIRQRILKPFQKRKTATLHLQSSKKRLNGTDHCASARLTRMALGKQYSTDDPFFPHSTYLIQAGMPSANTSAHPQLVSWLLPTRT